MTHQTENLHQGNRNSALGQGRPMIGFLSARIRGWSEHRFMSGVADFCRGEGLNLVFFVGEGLEETQPGKGLYKLIDPERFAGLMIGASLGRVSSIQAIEDFVRRFPGLPMVSWAVELPGIPTVLTDSSGGMRQVLEHLIQVHHYRRIGFIRGPLGQLESELRFCAYAEVLEAHGIALDPRWIGQGDLSRGGGRAAMQQLLERGADLEAVVSTDDPMAIGVMELLRERGLRVPEDLAVVGFDDIEEGRYAVVPLTTVRQSFYAAGRQAAQALSLLMRNERVPVRLTAPSSLLVRRSCGCFPVAGALAEDVPIVAPRGNALHELKRDQVVDALVRVVGLAGQEGESAGRPLSEWRSMLGRLWDAFLLALEKAEPAAFMQVLDGVLRQVRAEEGNVSAWPGVLLALRRISWPCLVDPLPRLQAQSLLQQGQVLLGESMLQSQAYQQIRIEKKEAVLQQVGYGLDTVLNLSRLGPTVSRFFPDLGIESCYLALYEDEHLPGNGAMLILAYDGQKVDTYPDGQPFPSRGLVPEGRLPWGQHQALVVHPLFLGDRELGFMLSGYGPRLWEIYARLREQFSEAIFRALRTVELARRIEQLDLINWVGRATASLLHLNTLLSQTAGIIQATFGYYAVLILLLEPDEKALSLSAAATMDGVEMEEGSVRLPVGPDNIIGQVAASGEPLVVEDVSQEPRYSQMAHLSHTRSTLALPLRMGNRVLGVLDLESIKPKAFASDDVQVLQTLADQIAIAIRNARLYQGEQSRRHLAEALEQAGRELSGSLDLQEVTGRILEQLDIVVPYERGAVLVQEGDRMRLIAHHGFPEDERLSSLQIPIREGDVFQQVVLARRPVFVDDISAVDSWLQVEWLPVNPSWLGVPLISKDRVMGMISLTRRDRGSFSRDDALLVSTFAVQAAIALENASLYNEIRRFNEQLELLVQQRTEELNRAYRMLERLDQTKADFIRIAAHELRTPLTVIKGYTQVLSMLPAVASDPSTKPVVEGILGGTDRLNEIVESMLDVTRLDAQSLTLYRQPASILSIINRVSTVFIASLEERRQSLTLDGLDELPPVQADPELLYKTFYQVVVNAIKYTPDGGAITISGAVLEGEEPAVEIVVSDNGIGIDPIYHEMIFEKFFQTGPIDLHSSGSTKFKGSGPGLGLAIARGIVLAHGGRIWVESEGYDEERCPGSSFHIVLPL